jgi:hypothetical protein
MQIAGSIVYGKHGSIMIRQKAETEIELGDLLVVDQASGNYSILQVYDLQYGSQIPDKNLEMISGIVRVHAFSAFARCSTQYRYLTLYSCLFLSATSFFLESSL